MDPSAIGTADSAWLTQCPRSEALDQAAIVDESDENIAVCGPAVHQNDQGIRKVIRNFTPS